MPLICEFDGIRIYMYWNDHQPPHFHVMYGEYKAIIEIRTGQLLAGTLPSSVLRTVREWQTRRVHDLIENWNLCQRAEHPHKLER